MQNRKTNPKSEYRNTKQIQMTEIRISQTPVSNFGVSNFEFVSDFEFRISNLTFDGVSV